MTKKPSGRQPSKQRKKIPPTTRAEEPIPATPSPAPPQETKSTETALAPAEEASAAPSRFDWAAEFVKLRSCIEIQKHIEEIEKAGNDAVLNLGINGAEQSRQKRPVLDKHLTQLGESVCESAKKWCTDLGKLAIAHPDKLGELSPQQWARQQTETELWAFLKLDTPASRLRRFIRRVCGGVDSIAAGLDLWRLDEPAPDEPPPRLLRWLDSRQYGATFGRREFEPPVAGDDAQLSPKDTEDFFCRKERELKSELEDAFVELGNALVAAEIDLFVKSVQTPAPPAKALEESPPAAGSGREPEVENKFLREGEVWTISYEGESVKLRHYIGLEMIAILLRQAGSSMSPLALEFLPSAALVQSSTPSREDDVRADERVTQEVLDLKGRRWYEAEASKLGHEIEEARKRNDTGVVEKLYRDLEMITDRLEADTARDGRSRMFPDDLEKARVRVTNSINRAITKIGKQGCPKTATHLRDNIETGTSMIYRDALTCWKL
ncbi:MAG: hypothetical protein ACHP7P_12015 [Terriglobales bacterium]